MGLNKIFIVERSKYKGTTNEKRTAMLQWEAWFLSNSFFRSSKLDYVGILQGADLTSNSTWVFCVQYTQQYYNPLKGKKKGI